MPFIIAAKVNKAANEAFARDFFLLPLANSECSLAFVKGDEKGYLNYLMHIFLIKA
jgi:hypothetical protein